MGLRPSIFLDVGSVFSVKRPNLTTLANFKDPADNLTKYLCRNAATGDQQFGTQGTDSNGAPTGNYSICPDGYSSMAPFEERFYGDTWRLEECRVGNAWYTTSSSGGEPCTK